MLMVGFKIRVRYWDDLIRLHLGWHLVPVQACLDLLLSGWGLCLPYPADTRHSARADSIEANVENAEVHVERGTEQLQRASYYQVGCSALCGEAASH